MRVYHHRRLGIPLELRGYSRNGNETSFRMGIICSGFMLLMFCMLILFCLESEELSDEQIAIIITRAGKGNFRFELEDDQNWDYGDDYDSQWNAFLNEYPKTKWDSGMIGLGPGFWKYHKPAFNCPAELLSHTGRKHSDGGKGKWTCGLENLGKLADRDGYRCNIYSFGVGGDSSFEKEILNKTLCHVFAYDLNAKEISYPLNETMLNNPRLHYHKAGIGGGQKETIISLMAKNQHFFADILKLDVDGEEYEALGTMLKDISRYSDYPLPFGQLLVEFHIWDFNDKNVQRFIKLARNLEKRGARLFAREPYYIDGRYSNSSQYSFINLRDVQLFVSV